jgi:hypothetical protein
MRQKNRRERVPNDNCEKHACVERHSGQHKCVVHRHLYSSKKGKNEASWVVTIPVETAAAAMPAVTIVLKFDKASVETDVHDIRYHALQNLFRD